VNPEFLRNVWLELSPRRLALMTGVLVLVFAAAALSGSGQSGPAVIAETLYYLIVVAWGARNASLGVVGEIRDRTWDLQRLSALGAGQMTWGKLFGATIYNWYGGAICLAVILYTRAAHQAAAATVLDAIYFITLGVIGQSAALLASLVAIRRRQAYSRLEVFIYQIVGILAAVWASEIWGAADPAGSLLGHKRLIQTVGWWGQRLDAQVFLLASLAIFAAWTLVACYRQMRLELKMRNGPLVWLAFLVFIGIYAAGFDIGTIQDSDIGSWSGAGLHLMLASATYCIITYAMVLLEPKDLVQLRWLGGRILSGRIVSAFANLDCWMTSYAATVLVSSALIWWLWHNPHSDPRAPAVITAALGFLTRDCAIFVLFRTVHSRRNDLSAVMVLIALYVLIPAILRGLHMDGALGYFLPLPTTIAWAGAGAAWVQAVVVVILASTRLAIADAPHAAQA
jgi:hypothetical protein